MFNQADIKPATSTGKVVSPSSIEAEEQAQGAEAIKQAVDNNSQPSPQLSLDSKSSKMSVIGDPNEVQPTKGEYRLKFIYDEDEVSAEDKARMTKQADGTYSVVVKYENRRVKPLYRTKVTLLVSRILSDMGVITEDGYNSDMLTDRATETLVDHIEDVAEIARMVLSVPREQMEYMSGDELAIFFSQVLNNEPNIIKEAVVFLGQQLKTKATTVNPTTEKASTPQS